MQIFRHREVQSIVGSSRFVLFDPSGKVISTSVEGEKPDGAVTVGASNPTICPVLVAGFARVEAGGTIAVEDEVMSANDGRAIVLGAGTRAGKAITGAVEGEIISIALLLF